MDREFIAVANVNARLTWHIQQISVIQGVQSLLSDNARQNDQTIGLSDSRKTKLIALVAQMVTTVFHQYEVGMREACIEAKVRKMSGGLREKCKYEIDAASKVDNFFHSANKLRLLCTCGCDDKGLQGILY